MENSILIGKNIWLTGAGRGIGLATAKKLANTGATIFLSSRNIENDILLQPDLMNNPNCIVLRCDVADRKDINAAYETIRELSGGIDILINNAGVGYFDDFVSLDDDDVEKMIDINFKGTYYCTKSVLDNMLKQESGIIINILSVAATTLFHGSSIYSATKAAILMMDRVLRNEIRGHGVKLIDILPGATDTDVWDTESRENSGYLMMQPEDVAETIYQMLMLSSNPRILPEEITIRPQFGDL